MNADTRFTSLITGPGFDAAPAQPKAADSSIADEPCPSVNPADVANVTPYLQKPATLHV